MQNQSSIPLENVLISTYKRIVAKKATDVEQQQSMLAKELRKTLYVFFFVLRRTTARFTPQKQNI